MSKTTRRTPEAAFRRLDALERAQSATLRSVRKRLKGRSNLTRREQHILSGLVETCLDLMQGQATYCLHKIQGRPIAPQALVPIAEATASRAHTLAQQLFDYSQPVDG